MEIQSKLGFSITKKRKGKDDGDVRNGHNVEGTRVCTTRKQHDLNKKSTTGLCTLENTCTRLPVCPEGETVNCENVRRKSNGWERDRYSC